MEAVLLDNQMAKSKPKKSAPEPEPEPVNRKPMIVQVRGSAEYKTWAEGIADKEGDTLAKLVDRALREFAKGRGYLDPPKR
jgi:hypothetical protein